jgi:hypothetical protein
MVGFWVGRIFAIGSTMGRGISTEHTDLKCPMFIIHQVVPLLHSASPTVTVRNQANGHNLATKPKIFPAALNVGMSY